MNTFETGRLISSCRKEKGLTQSDLADMLKISNRTVSKWENGDGFPDITIVPQLCEILSITSDELLAGKKNIPETEEKPEALFEATSPSAVKYYEAIFKLHNERYVPRWSLILLGGCIAILLFLEYILNLNYIFLYIGIIWFVLLAIALFCPKLAAITKIKEIKELNNGKLCDQELRITDKLELKCGNGKNEIELNQISALYEKKNLYILRLNKRHYTYVLKDAFTTGNAEDFAAYIRSHTTQKKESRIIRLIAVILVVFATVGTIIAASGVAFVSLVNQNQSYQDYIEMDSQQLSNLDDEELYEAVAAKIDNKYYYEEKELNKYERTFYEVDDLMLEYECGGFCQYLYNREDGKIEQLYNALNDIGADKLSKKLKTFIDDNGINPIDFNSKSDYEALAKKYPFDELDKNIENDCKLLKILLIEYARKNVNNF